MGRPATKPKQLKDGYYIEIKNKNQRNTIKIRRDTLDQLKIAINKYKGNKDVQVLGRLKKGKFIEIADVK